MQQRVPLDLGGELLQLFLGRQFAVDQQVADLDERRLLGELLDRVAAVAQDARVAVDVGDGALGGGGVDEAAVEGGVAGLGEQRTQRDSVGALGRVDDVQVELATGVFEGGVLFTTGCVIGHGNPFFAAVNADVCPTKGSPIPAVVPARGLADAQTGCRTSSTSPMNSANAASSRETMSSMPTCCQSVSVAEVAERGHDDRGPHGGHQLEFAVVQVDAHPLGQLDVDRVWPVLGGGVTQRGRGHDDPHRAHHSIGREPPGGAVLVPLYIAT